MKVECKNKYKMDYSYLDKNLKLKINECFNLAQNNATEYFKKFNEDNFYVKDNYNAVYVRDIMNSLSNDFLNKVSITDVEMHYIAESKEGQILKIYKKELENNIIRFLIKEKEREIIRASISYSKNDL